MSQVRSIKVGARRVCVELEVGCESLKIDGSRSTAKGKCSDGKRQVSQPEVPSLARIFPKV